MSPESRDDRGNQRVEEAFRAEQDRSLALAARVLLAVLAIVAVWVHIENGVPAAFFFYPSLLAFGLLVTIPHLLARWGHRALWHQYVANTLWVLVLTATVMASNPLDAFEFPPQYRLQFGNQMYLFLLVIASAFSYAPRVVLWTGFVAAIAWGGASWWMYHRPDTIHDTALTLASTVSRDERFAIVLSPYYVNVGRSVREVLLLLVGSWIVAAFVWRARALVYQQARIERERANLSRYFSANMVDELAKSDAPLEETRAQEIAVLFADIVGFTHLTSELPPRQVIALLRDFHERTAAAVFEHGGTLDKFIGDGVMATFGTPRHGADDATRALLCAHSILAAVDAWNAQRLQRGLEAIRVGIGVHYGSVVAGDIGGPQRFEFAVVGDTVNVASRLERLTRELDACVVISDAAVTQARSESTVAAELLAGFERIDEREIRGRRHGLTIWFMPRRPSPSAP